MQAERQLVDGHDWKLGQSFGKGVVDIGYSSITRYYREIRNVGATRSSSLTNVGMACAPVYPLSIGRPVRHRPAQNITREQPSNFVDLLDQNVAAVSGLSLEKGNGESQFMFCARRVRHDVSKACEENCRDFDWLLVV